MRRSRGGGEGRLWRIRARLEVGTPYYFLGMKHDVVYKDITERKNTPGQAGGSRINLEEGAREVSRLKEQVESKVGTKYFSSNHSINVKIFKYFNSSATNQYHQKGGRALNLSGGGGGATVQAIAGSKGRNHKHYKKSYSLNDYK